MRHTRFTLIRTTAAALGSLGLLCAAALADNGTTTVYKWIDAQGVVHYSDQPHPNAQKLEVRGAQTFSSLPLAPPGSSAPTQPQPAGGPAYDNCAIAQPADQQMLMNVYNATAVVQTSPPLRAGDQVHLFVDGKQIQGGSTSFTFPVVRGQHSVQAVIEDNSGQIVCETTSVTFFVHQPSIADPHNPVHPR